MQGMPSEYISHPTPPPHPMRTPYPNISHSTQAPEVSFIQYLIDTNGQPVSSSTIDTQLMPFDAHTNPSAASPSTPVDLRPTPNSLHSPAPTSPEDVPDIEQILAAIDALPSPQIPAPMFTYPKSITYPKIFLTYALKSTLNSRDTRNEFAVISGVSSWPNTGDPGSIEHATSIAGADYQIPYAPILWGIHNREPHTLTSNYSVLNVVSILASSGANPGRLTTRYLPMGNTAIKADGSLDIQATILYGWDAELTSGEMGIGVDIILMLREHQALESTTRQPVHESQMPSQLLPSSPDTMIRDPYLRRISSSSSADYRRPSVGNEPNMSLHRYSRPPSPSLYGPSHSYYTAPGDYGPLHVPPFSDPYSGWSDESLLPLSMRTEPKRSVRPDLGATTGYKHQPNWPPQLFHSAADDLVARPDQRRNNVIATGLQNHQSRKIEPYSSPVASGSGSGSGSGSDMPALDRGAQHAIDNIKTEMPMQTITSREQSSPFDGMQQSAPGESKDKANANASDAENGNNLSRVSETEFAGEATWGLKPKDGFARHSASAGEVGHSPLSPADSFTLASGSHDDQGRGALQPMFDIYEAIPTAPVIPYSATNESGAVGDEMSASFLVYRGTRTTKRGREQEAEEESIKRARIGGDIGDGDEEPLLSSYYSYY